MVHRLLDWLKHRLYWTEYVHGPRSRLQLGQRVGCGNTLFNTRSGSIFVGDGVVFGHNVMVLTGLHTVTKRGSVGTRETDCEAQRDIHIESGAWIGSGAIILGGVRIGRDTVIGAGSVVTKDMPSEVLAAGNPCRVIRKIEYD